MATEHVGVQLSQNIQDACISSHVFRLLVTHGVAERVVRIWVAPACVYTARGGSVRGGALGSQCRCPVHTVLQVRTFLMILTHLLGPPSRINHHGCLLPESTILRSLATSQRTVWRRPPFLSRARAFKAPKQTRKNTTKHVR